MRAGFAYKHENCTDSFIEIMKVQYHDNKRVKVRVIWWTIGTTRSWPSGLIETIEIKREDLAKWKPYSKDIGS